MTLSAALLLVEQFAENIKLVDKWGEPLEGIEVLALAESESPMIQMLQQQLLDSKITPEKYYAQMLSALARFREEWKKRGKPYVEYSL